MHVTGNLMEGIGKAVDQSIDMVGIAALACLHVRAQDR